MLDFLVFLFFGVLLVFLLVWVNRVDEKALRAERAARQAPHQAPVRAEHQPALAAERRAPLPSAADVA